jgi:hypothetical protein
MVFPVVYEEEGIEWHCDYNDVCWYFQTSTEEICIRDYDCFAPADALDLYFSHEEEEHLIWFEDFDWADWRSNFDMTYDGWYDDYDWSFFFPNYAEIEGYEY